MEDDKITIEHVKSCYGADLPKKAIADKLIENTYKLAKLKGDSEKESLIKAAHEVGNLLDRLTK